MKHRFVISALAAVAMLSGCANQEAGGYHPPAGQKVRITQQIYQYFLQYQQTIGSSHLGAFAVSESGRNAFYQYCEDVRCVSGSAYGLQAVANCNKWGSPCYVFAYGNDIKVDYEVMP